MFQAMMQQQQLQIEQQQQMITQLLQMQSNPHQRIHYPPPPADHPPVGAAVVTAKPPPRGPSVQPSASAASAAQQSAAQQAVAVSASSAATAPRPAPAPVITPFNLTLEAACPAGYDCPDKTNPSKCAKNHRGLGTVIPKGTARPRFLCMHERPENKKRCNNPACYFDHLEGRCNFIAKHLAAQAAALAAAQSTPA